MHVMRTAPPGSALVDWVPPFSTGKGMKVSSFVLGAGPADVWQQAINDRTSEHSNVIVQLEDADGAQLKSLPGTRKIGVVWHQTPDIPTSGYSRIVVPSFYVREQLYRSGIRKVTTLFPTAPDSWHRDGIIEGRSAYQPSLQQRPLRVLLHPGTTTKRMLDTLLSLSRDKLQISWRLITIDSHRHAAIRDKLQQHQQTVHAVDATDPDAWQLADVLVTDQQPAWSLNPLHVKSLALGLPILTTGCGDHPELVKHMHNGLLLTLGQLGKDLEYYLNLIVKEPHLLQQFSINARQLYDKYYSPTHIATQWVALYKSLIRIGGG